MTWSSSLYLARNSAARHGLLFPKTPHPDLYLRCLELCLRHVRCVVAIVPDSFLQAGRLQDRCQGVVSLPVPMFGDTGHPVCLPSSGRIQPPRALSYPPGRSQASKAQDRLSGT